MLLGFRDGRAALAHDAAIAANAADAILPALAVFSIALALVDQLAKLGAPLVVLNLMRRQAGDYVIAVVQQLPDEPDGEGRERRCEKPCPRRVVRGCRCTMH